MKAPQIRRPFGINIGLFLIRLALCIVFIPHGAQKLFGLFGGQGFQGTMTYFTQVQHIAIPLAILAIFTEFLAPLALLFGLLTRLAAFGLGCIAVVAAVTVNLQNGFFMNWLGNQKGEGIEYFILAGAMSLALIFAGAGDWSLDAKIFRALRRRPRSEPALA